MPSNFILTLHLTKHYAYQFSYPIGSKPQHSAFRTELAMSTEDYESYKPQFQKLNLYDRRKFLKTINEADFASVFETHACREIALSKGEFYSYWQSAMSVIYKHSMLSIEYPSQVPSTFKEIVTTALLDPYAVNQGGSHIHCDLDTSMFGLAMEPCYWNKAWLSLLTYFAKYGGFMDELAIGRYGSKDQYSLDEVIQVILDSWRGQVGLYTAFGLWLWANKDDAAIHGDYERFNGIHSAMNHFAALYAPYKLIEFLGQYNLDLDRVSRLFIQNYEERLEIADLQLPSWYVQGSDNDANLAESPEWNDYMGYGDDDDDEDGEYYGDDIFDFGED